VFVPVPLPNHLFVRRNFPEVIAPDALLVLRAW
jgi:hypothetical protein